MSFLSTLLKLAPVLTHWGAHKAQALAAEQAGGNPVHPVLAKAEAYAEAVLTDGRALATELSAVYPELLPKLLGSAYDVLKDFQVLP